MSTSVRTRIWVSVLAVVAGILAVSPAYAAEEAPYEADPVLSLTGNCSTIANVDPVPDPSCSGEPLAYPPPPNGPTGQFIEPRALAIDLHGNQYVISFAAGNDAKGRLDVFDDEGKFITENPVRDAQTAAVDSKGNLYVFQNDGDVVRYSPSEYEPEEGKIKYGNAPVVVASGAFQGAVVVDTDPAHLDQVLIARPFTIARYKSAADAEPNGLIESVEPPGLGPWPEAMAIDSQRRRLYVASCKNGPEECGVKIYNSDDLTEELEEIDGSTTPAEEFAAFAGGLPIAIDEETGDFFIADPLAHKLYRFTAEYEFASEQEFKELIETAAVQITISNGKRSPSAEACKYPVSPPPPAGDACNRHYLYVPVYKSKGRLAAFHPPGQIPPVIEAVSTGRIGRTEAEITATIFPGGLPTEYHFEITTQAAWEAEGFSGAITIPGGTLRADSLATGVSAFATGLTPGESYRYRVVAGNDLGAAEEEGQNEASFTTYNDAPISPPLSCPNESLRFGRSALLPDCRAYELVSPADTSGRPPKGVAEQGSFFSTLEASPAGTAVSFKIEGGSVPGSSGIGSFEGDPYVSRRSTTGWNTELAGASGDEATVSAPASTSPDQGYAFWQARGEGPLVIEPIVNEYLHYPDGHSELIGRGSEGVEPRATGKLITENATHIVFQSFNLGFNKAVKLEPDAPPEGTEAVYDRTIDPVTKAEETHVVSLLPGDITPGAGQDADYQGASKDGEGIAFSIGNTLYLRVGNTTTYEIGTGVEFAGVSEGGDRIFYVEGGDLLAFDTSTEEVIEFSSTGDVTPVNVATGGTRAYFVSPSVLGGANPQGDTAQIGEQNLYLSEEGAIAFVATVTDRDVEGEPAGIDDGLGLWTKVVGNQVARDPSRTNPDGSVLLFQSRANITGYEESAFPQIYRYDSGAGNLSCLSCIPTGVPASGGASFENYSSDSTAPQPFSAFGYVPGLTPDGGRAFFNSEEALVATDTDKVADVYEWEANGVGSCTRSGGCVYLISSGQSERANFIYGHSTNGDDVFFTTGDKLTGWDSGDGAVSIYDARVGGGFPDPPTAEDCVADGCRPELVPGPDLGRPEAGGEGNVPPKPVKHCPKGKRKVKKNGKVRCVKKKKHKGKGGKAKQRAGTNRGAGK